jgi:uncharacterized membrane protein
MTAPHAKQIVAGYLARLDQELDSLSALTSSEKSEALAQIESHVNEARGALTDETDADILNILDRLGSPDEVADSVRSSRPDASIPVAPKKAPTTFERTLVMAAILMWAGGLASLIGALVLFSTSDFEPASFLSLFAGICGVMSGAVVFKRPAVAVVGVLLAAVAVGRNLTYWYLLPSNFNTIDDAALVMLVLGGALAGVAATLLHPGQVPKRSS